MLLALGLFVFGYVVSMTFTSVFYHRALAHEAIEISPRMKKLIGLTGMLITGIDPKGWVCMHRLHHEHSDTPLDPHSPAHTGFWYTFIKQHKSFERILVKLIKRDKEFEKIVRDIPFDVHFLNKMGLWYVPFVLHAVVGVIIGTAFDNYLAGIAYFIGICGHPLQGFLVNAFGHSIGYRNFNCPDQSTNNTFVALTCFGEGYQNNHHRFPTSPKFSIRSSEFDFGFGIIKFLSLLNVVKIYRDQIPKGEREIPSPLEMLENN
jgi:stearoyl-CoA desaturase (delta-9 desaturase)